MSLCLNRKIFAKILIFMLAMFLNGTITIPKAEADYCDIGGGTIWCDDWDNTVSIGTTTLQSQLYVKSSIDSQ